VGYIIVVVSHVCMYVCMYVRTYVRTYVCMYVHTYICIYSVSLVKCFRRAFCLQFAIGLSILCNTWSERWGSDCVLSLQLFGWSHGHKSGQIMWHTYACIHTYIHAYIHTYIHTYIHMYIHTYIHTQTQKGTSTHIQFSNFGNS